MNGLTLAFIIVVLAIGTFLIFSGIRQPRDRKRLLYSGVGSIVVGLGNLLILASFIAGLALVIVGAGVIAASVRTSD